MLRFDDERSQRGVVGRVGRPWVLGTEKASRNTNPAPFEAGFAFLIPLVAWCPSGSLSYEERCQHQGDRAEEFDQHMKRRACRIFERIANSVADD